MRDFTLMPVEPSGAQWEVRVKILARAGRDRKAARLMCAQLGTWARPGHRWKT